jgi:hypothetical protein
VTRVKRARHSLVRAALLGALVLVTGREASAQSCDAEHLIRWPDTNPVWQLCWAAPPDSSGIDGSGLEITDVFYKGALVLARGGVPVINVKYDPGGCGGPDLSYRDWGNELVRFEADNVIRPGYAEPTAPPRTVCDTPGSDVGTFTGVAAEKLTDRLVLTTQVQAGWYRYILSWTFLADGTFKPGIRFNAVENICTPLAHYHNVYWRLDFDIGDAANDAIDERNLGTWSALRTEAQRLHAPAAGRGWRIRDKLTGAGYELVPAPDADIADSWSSADFFGLLYREGEEDDGGATGGADGDRAHVDRYVNGETIDDRDLVVWYRSGVRHEGPADCELGGPTLLPVRAPFAAVRANGEHGVITVGPSQPLVIDLSFDQAGPTFLNPAEVYLGVATPFGTYFWDPVLRFVPTPARLFSGPLASFGPSVFVNLASAGSLPPGAYVWFLVVDADANGSVDGTFYGYVVTIVSP